ncbi:MAG: type 1 glutamine amidotransferase [Candidatus Bathyarchaeota archaeon]|nr:type 1 glutamine amidotransferase [Candidatus Bathyarchaeota archaeon]
MSASKVLMIQNDEIETFGLYEKYLKEREIEYRILYAYRLQHHESFPSVENYDAFIIGPTPISANNIDKHVFLMKEWEYLVEIIESGTPCLGVCCGAQLLAKYLGADVGRSPEREIGIYVVRLTRDGEADPLFTGFPSEFPVFHWHGDMFEVPHGGRLLAEGKPCPIQAFGWGKVRGILFHLEMEVGTTERWVNAYQTELDEVGKTMRKVLEECKEREPEMKRLAYLLMDNFLHIINEHSV